jgi:hypothetical protein
MLRLRYLAPSAAVYHLFMDCSDSTDLIVLPAYQRLYYGISFGLGCPPCLGSFEHRESAQGI